MRRLLKPNLSKRLLTKFVKVGIIFIFNSVSTSSAAQTMEHNYVRINQAMNEILINTLNTPMSLSTGNMGRKTAQTFVSVGNISLAMNPEF